MSELLRTSSRDSTSVLSSTHAPRQSTIGGGCAASPSVHGSGWASPGNGKGSSRTSTSTRADGFNGGHPVVKSGESIGNSDSYHLYTRSGSRAKSVGGDVPRGGTGERRGGTGCEVYAVNGGEISYIEDAAIRILRILLLGVGEPSACPFLTGSAMDGSLSPPHFWATFLFLRFPGSGSTQLMPGRSPRG